MESTDNQVLIKIQNCNNILDGKIILNKGTLNLKHAMNGTGKSTISTGIKLYSENKDLLELKSFLTNSNPNLEFSENFENVTIFDEEFVNNIVFKEDEVIQNSFDIFIKTPTYDQRRTDLNNRLKNLKINIAENEEINKFFKALTEVCNKFYLNKDNSMKKTPFLKSLLKRDNLFNIPEKLNKYKDFMHDEQNIEWIDWKSKGFNYDKKEICPFCTEKLKTEYKEEKEIFKKTYNKKTSQDFINMLNFFTSLEKYIKKEKYINLIKYIKKEKDESLLEMELNKFILEVFYIKEKITNILNFDSYNIKNEEISTLDEKVSKLKIEISSLDIFSSEKSFELINIIKEQLDNIINEIDELKIEVGKLDGYIKAAIKKSKQDINNFLESAGITYEVDIIVESKEKTKTILKYKCPDNEYCNIENIKKHLSWGEKNAFALMLFMHYSVQQSADLIILDDPISSFDSNKKYAILNRLFKNTNKGNTLYKKTVLMLTHDFEPIIDFIVNHKPTGGYVKAYYLKNNNGLLNEQIIEKNDIVPLTHMLSENSKNEELNIIHRVVSLRKLIEISYPNEEIAYDILSSLIHGKEIPDKKIGSEEYQDFTELEILTGTNFIKNYIEHFDYTYHLQNSYKEDLLLAEYKAENNSYLKLQIFRLYLEIKGIRDKIKDDVILKFIDNVYHVENDFTYCLNHFKYNIVPNYIINKIDSFMSKELL